MAYFRAYAPKFAALSEAIPSANNSGITWVRDLSVNVTVAKITVKTTAIIITTFPIFSSLICNCVYNIISKHITANKKTSQ
jgi:hypothetical protein